MILKCQLQGMKCPRYLHQGSLIADDQTFKKFQSDLRKCANCMAYEFPQIPDFRDDLIQIGAITLFEKGPEYQPNHESGASFGSFIRPYICGSLRDTRRKELKQRSRYLVWDSEYRSANQEAEPDIGLFWCIPDENAEFEDQLIRELQIEEFERILPEILPRLTPREQQVFELQRAGIQQCDIALELALSKARISQILKAIVRKLKKGCEEFGVIERNSKDTY